jgi:hypothetical protein
VARRTGRAQIEVDRQAHASGRPPEEASQMLDRPHPAIARFAIAIIATLIAAPVLACSVCGCGDPLLTSSDPAAINGTLRLQVDYEQLRIDAGTDGAPGFTDQLTQGALRLNVAYRPAEDLSLTLTLPMVQKKIVSVGPAPSVTDSDLSGLGDIEVGARYAAWRSVEVGARRVQELAFGLGASIPSGAHDARLADGSLLDPHGQLGTGGWGPFATVAYRHEQGDWTGYGSLGYRLRTEASYFDGSKYKFGDATLWGVHGQYQVGRRVVLDLGVDGRYAVADRATDPDGVVTGAVGNTGGALMSAVPAVYVEAFRGGWLFARSQIPFYKDLLGEQDVRPNLTIGVQYQVN